MMHDNEFIAGTLITSTGFNCLEILNVNETQICCVDKLTHEFCLFEKSEHDFKLFHITTCLTNSLDEILQEILESVDNVLNPKNKREILGKMSKRFNAWIQLNNN